MVGSLTLMPEASSLFSPVNLSSKEFAHDPDVVYKLTDFIRHNTLLCRTSSFH